MSEYTPETECPDCSMSEEPCAFHRKEIHRSWHAQGLWWIRPEECDEGCPGYAAKEAPRAAP